MADIVFVRTGGPLGATATGVDLSLDLPMRLVRRLARALGEHLLLIFRGQSLTQGRLLEVARAFGPIFEPPSEEPVLGGAGQGQIVIVSNVEKGGVLGSHELPAHSDQQFLAEPPRLSLLYAAEVPDKGGETSWSNLCQAWKELDARTQRRLEGLRVWSRNPYAGEKAARELVGENQTYSDAKLPRHPHPVVQRHNATGRKALYVSPTSSGLVGKPWMLGRKALLRRLKHHVDQAHLYYTHRWEPGDVVVWDNLFTNHKRAAFDHGSRRVLYRVHVTKIQPGR